MLGSLLDVVEHVPIEREALFFSQVGAHITLVPDAGTKERIM
jgi:hypothetical protein